MIGYLESMLKKCNNKALLFFVTNPHEGHKSVTDLLATQISDVC